ncbi:MAG TPA: hypothetical protein VFO08_08710 [Methylomirabilota bacterium]|nr:hypothetical protein [Methylomirabilota bacterium]
MVVTSTDVAIRANELSSRREATMRYAWIGLLLLLAGCAGYLPPATGQPAPSTFD